MAHARRLWLTEKPNTARVLKKFVHPDDDVLAAQGHLYRTAEPDEIDERWKRPWNPQALPIYVDEIPMVIGTDRSGRSLKPRVDAIRAALKDVDEVVVSTDPGREGSLIGWEILVELRWRGPVRRLALGALDDTSVKAAIKRMEADPSSGDKDWCAYMEALCRQFEDWGLGMSGTRLLTLFLKPPEIHGVWSYGGVQMPTLALLADREVAIRSFVPKEFFRVAMDVETHEGHELRLIHAPEDKVFDRKLAEQIKAAAEPWKGKLAVERKQAKRQPPKLFSLNSLQKACAKKFGWRPDKTEKVADSLYNKGAATYPRTEVDVLKDTEIENAGDILAAIAASLPDLSGLIPDEPFIRKPHTYKAVDAEHYAFVPTAQPLPDDADQEEADLYNLIARMFLAHHLPDAIDDVTVVKATVPAAGQPRVFAARGIVEVERGWRIAFPKAKEPGADETLPPVHDGDDAAATAVEVQADWTKPPARITVGELPSVMARLIDFVEDPELKAALHNPSNPDEPKGLGSAASRKDVVTKLLKRSYVIEMAGKSKDPPLQVSDDGMALIAALRRAWPRDADPVRRAVFESELNEIGKAGSRAEANRRAAAFRERCKENLQKMTDAIQGQGPVQSEGGGRRSGPPTPSMVKFARTLAERKGIKLPRDVANDFDACKAFLDQNAPARPEGDGDRLAGPRPPSEAQVGLMKRLSQELDEEVPERALSDGKAASDWIDKAMARSRKAGADRPRPTGPSGRPPSEKQVQLMKRLAQERGVDIPDAARGDGGEASAWIDSLMGGGEGGERKPFPPSEKQVSLVRRLMEEKGMEPPAGWEQDGRLASRFIDDAMGGGRGGSSGSRTPSGGKGSLGGRGSYGKPGGNSRSSGSSSGWGGRR